MGSPESDLRASKEKRFVKKHHQQKMQTKQTKRKKGKPRSVAIAIAREKLQ